MFKQDLDLDNLQWLICHKILPTKQLIVVFEEIVAT